VLIFLPPSEGKTEPSVGDPVALDSLAFPESLGEVREGLLNSLTGMGSLDRGEAIAMLGISAGQAGDVDRNAELMRAPAGPAIDVYSGVLFDRLDFGSLSSAAKKRAASELLIASALWGVLRPTDPIPWYRCAMKAKLPGAGGLAALWRPVLGEALESAGTDREGELIIDLRSGAYSAAWKPKRAELVSVRCFTEQGGSRKPVSHMAKAIRGEVARIVLEAGQPPSDATGLAALVEANGKRVELGDGTLDVIESA
jgi:uncharacterized protein